MDIESEICRRYEAELASLAVLDRAYYLNKTPSQADRAAYFARQQELEAIRTRFQSELNAIRGADNGEKR